MGIVVFALLITNVDPPVEEAKQKTEVLRSYYTKAPAKYAFFRDDDRQQPLSLVEKPVMTWANDGDWSGDVFVWTWKDHPEVIGCPLTDARA